MTSGPPPQPPQGGPPPGGQPGYGQKPPYGHPTQGQPPYGQQPQQPPYGQPPQYGAPNPYGQPAGSSGSSVDFKRLKMADYVIAAGTLVFLVLSLLPWVDYGDYIGFDVPGVSDSISGFAFSGLVSTAFFLFLVATVWALLPAFTDLKLGFPRGWVTVGLATLGFILTLFAWIQALSYEFSIVPLLATLVALAIALFAFLSLLPELRNKPALPGGLANAAQWANQPAPDLGQQFGQQGQSGQGQHMPPQPPQHQAPPAQQFGQPMPPQQPGQYSPPPPPPAPPGPSYGQPGGSSAPGHGPGAPPRPDGTA